MATRRKKKPIQRRCTVERLEDRAMLSASNGHVPQGHAYGIAKHGGEQRSAEPAALASNSKHSGAFDKQVDRGGPGSNFRSGPTFDDRGSGSRPSMQDSFNRVQNAFHSQSLTQEFHPQPTYGASQIFYVWYHEFVNYAPVQYVASYTVVTATNSSSVKQETVTVTQSRPAVARNESPISQDLVGAIKTVGSSLGSYTPPIETVLNSNLASRPVGVSPPNIVSSIVSTLPTIAPVADVLSIAPTFVDLPAVTQVLGINSSVSTLISATSRDLAFQDFAPRLLLATNSASSDRLSVASLSNRTSVTAIDGFITSTDSRLGWLFSSADAVAREREAITKVLNELHDVSSLPSAPSDADATMPIADVINSEQSDELGGWAEIEVVSGESTAIAFDGGMILLETTGETSDAAFDLTPVYAQQLERFNVPAAMEASVGIYQAVDMITDGSVLADSSAESIDSVIATPHDGKLDQALPSPSAQISTERAAAILGATTLTGALLWMSRATSDHTAQDPTAKKRRARIA